MGARISTQARRELLRALYERYQEAKRAEKVVSSMSS